MFLRDAAQAALVITVGKERWRVPRFTLGDFVSWGAEVDQDRLERATAHMNEKARFEYVSYYDIPPCGLKELISLLRTPKGAQRVLSTCLGKTKVFERDGQAVNEDLPADRAEAVVIENLYQLEAVLRRLAPVTDPSTFKDEESTAEEDKGEQSPLTGSGTPASPATAKTSEESLPSSPPSIPDETPSD